MKRFNNDKGSMFVVLIIAMTLIAVLGAAFVSMVSSKQKGFTLLLNGHRANMIARAGVEWAIRYASEGNSVNDSNMPFDPDDPNEGSFRTSYNEAADILTVDGTYQGTTQRITLSNFHRYLKIGDVSFPLSMDSFKPVESETGKSIAVDKTGVIHLGQKGSETFGAVWYGGGSAAGNCVNGACDFGNGFRAYFVFQFAPGSTGDGFTFAVISNGSNGEYNTANSVGGDSNMGELMAYGGDSRVYSNDGYIKSFTDGSGKGLRPPKFAVEFDIYPNTDCSLCGGRCDDPSNQHMAYVFWGDDNRIGCKDNYTRWMSSFSFPADTVVYGTTGYLYRKMNNLITGTTEPTWPTEKGSTVTEPEPAPGAQWQECSWRPGISYVQGDVVAPSAPNGSFFRESQPVGTTGSEEPDWTKCVLFGVCADNSAGWQNAAPALSVKYATNSRTYDDNRHGAGTGVNAGNSGGTGPTNTTSSGSYYTSPTDPTKWLADTANPLTVNRTYAYRMEVVRNKATGTYQIKSWIKTCDPPWSQSTAYAVGDLIRPAGNNGYYYVVTTAGTSGATEPSWPASGTVTDGTVTWVPVPIPGSWNASTAYAVNKQVRPTVNNGYYYVATTAGTSGAAEPAWSASGRVTDGTVTWVPVQMTICNKYTNGTLGDVQYDYSTDSPTLYRTITLDTTLNGYNDAFNKFLFGWTTASGGATQKADVWKFRLSFKP